MKHLLWLVPVITGLASMHWPKLQGIALASMLVCGIITYLVVRAGRTGEPRPPLGAEQKRDYYSVSRDLPPGPMG
jgi:hypothetical protein